MGENIPFSLYRHSGGNVSSARSGFSLIELVVSLAVISILSTLTVVAVSKVKAYSEVTRAVSGARALITAYLSHGTENNGHFMLGYDISMSNQSDSKMDGQMMVRYPYRLSPYYGESYNGPMWVNGNKEQIDEKYGGNDRYQYSAHPAFGMNFFFVGGKSAIIGYDADNKPVYGPDDNSKENAILYNSQAESQIIVFASSGRFNIDGWHLVTPPQFYDGFDDSKSWNSVRSWTPKSNPENYGYVNARYDSKAVVAQLGGSVQLMSIEDLNDMRLWSSNALLRNNSHYQPIASEASAPPPPTRPRR